MKEIARMIKEIILDKKSPKKVKKEVIELRENFQEIKYCLPRS
jgi:glycine/serine hydroxymethyltransferase